MEKVTLITPMYNSFKFLQEAVESIQEQTYKHFHILLIDDMSTDDTYEVANNLANRYGNITVKKNKYKKGIAGATNTGLDLAETQYIALMDHDDISLSQRFEVQVKFLETHPEIGVCGSWMQEFGAGSNIWDFPSEDEDLKAICLLHSPIPNSTAMIRRSILEKYKLRYKDEFNIAQDYEFWLNLTKYTRFHVIPEVLVRYRIHTSNASSVSAREQYLAWKKALTHYTSGFRDVPKEEFYEIVYQMKYPDFPEFYKENQTKVDGIIDYILHENKRAEVFPHEALIRLFEHKRQLWSS